MNFIIAGHHDKDPGCVANGFKEAELTKELRGLISDCLKEKGVGYILDKDHETIQALLSRIKPGKGSVLLDIHFNASANAATGIEAIVSDNANDDERAMATDLCNAGVRACGFYNRGVKKESQTPRKRLAMLHTPAGIQVLLEVCFMTNREDMIRYQRYKETLAELIATILEKWENKYQ